MSIASMPLRAVAAHRFEIGIADREIVADRAAEAGEADADRRRGRRASSGHVDREPPFLDAQGDAERAVMAGEVEMIALEQVEDRDSPLLLDVGLRLRIERSSSWMSMIRGSAMAAC